MARRRGGRPPAADAELGLTDGDPDAAGLVKYEIRTVAGREILINEGEGEELHSVLRSPEAFLAVVRLG